MLAAFVVVEHACQGINHITQCMAEEQHKYTWLKRWGTEEDDKCKRMGAVWRSRICRGRAYWKMSKKMGGIVKCG